MDILLAIKATIAGAILGAIFQKLKLPLPAPPVFPGVVGVLGVLVGSKIAQFF
ncbi:XapX domain-containing protein [Alkalithermobacter thermoalcaliphilus JW-YL-7 = DSM 7308]|uniref:XapX domain-containing protein n=1 Tax=Alkalithermobacter thermoalcaliphilus JW-YL-7 = DSM 7308 TaxID=1121328 RepID=A0A150FMM5_CLOPD|nr:XapX domain containing protein [[Clostridium] paradoxum JW-YL-7 = DSM 7308]SHL30801.1 XapX domain-containing protein [[Clostridium] paradoxum JW-YL-7 = DSM 7308]